MHKTRHADHQQHTGAHQARHNKQQCSETMETNEHILPCHACTTQNCKTRMIAKHFVDTKTFQQKHDILQQDTNKHTATGNAQKLTAETNKSYPTKPERKHRKQTLHARQLCLLALNTKRSHPVRDTEKNCLSPGFGDIKQPQ